MPAVLFNIYDFDESGELTIDEITLCLKSTLSGLAKVSNDVPPLEPDIELVAQDVRGKPRLPAPHTTHSALTLCAGTGAWCLLLLCHPGAQEEWQGH